MAWSQIHNVTSPTVKPTGSCYSRSGPQHSGFQAPSNARMSSAETSHSKPATDSRNLSHRPFMLALVLAVVWGMFQTDRYIKRLLADQNLILDYAVAQHLEQNLSDGQVALVFAQPMPPSSAQQYLDKVYSQGGTQALEVARRQLADLNSGPLDYSRVVVNTRRRRNQIVDGSKLIVNASDAASFLSQNRVRLAAVFSNYPAQEVNTRHLLDYCEAARQASSYSQGSRLAGVHLRGAVLKRCRCSSVLSDMKEFTSALNRFSSNGAAVSRMSCG